MSNTAIVENLLDLAAQVIHQKEVKKVFDYLHGESQLLNYLYKQKDHCGYPKAISEKLQVTPARVAVLLNKLQKEGWIEREPDPIDSRKTRVCLTDKGIQELLRRKRESLSYVKNFLDRLSDDEIFQLLNFTARIVK